MENLLGTALPEFSKIIQEKGRMSFGLTLEPLESRLLGELKSMIQGKEADAEAVMRAAEIIKLVEKVKSEQAKQNLEIPEQ